MKLIRVLVGNHPRLMRELILSTISEQPDIEIVGEIREESDIEHLVEQTHPDFLIVDLNGNNQVPASCRQILGKHPNLKILAIPSGRNTRVCYSLTLEVRASKVEASESNLLKLLRGESPTEGGGRR
jgi:DNA-binding NarL/FixJ family response regulator